MKALLKGLIVVFLAGCLAAGVGAYWLHGQVTHLLEAPLSVLEEEHTFLGKVLL